MLMVGTNIIIIMLSGWEDIIIIIFRVITLKLCCAITIKLCCAVTILFHEKINI